ncbi:aspartate 1-decarboxylase [Acidobacteriota bacterium]
MQRIMLKAKIHRATVTETNLGYEGSLVLDEDLMAEAFMLPYEQVHVYNISNGERFITCLTKGEKGSGIVGVQGIAADRIRAGDKLTISSYVVLGDEEIDFFMPKNLFVDEKNRIREIQ